MNEKRTAERIQNKKLLMDKKRWCEKRLQRDFRRKVQVTNKKNTWNNENMHNSKKFTL